PPALSLYSLSLHDALPIYGRFLASAGSDGVRLWDTATGREVHHLDTVGGVESVQFDPVDEGFITYGKAGLYYWPAQVADTLKSRDRKSTRLNSSHVAISYA